MRDNEAVAFINVSPEVGLEGIRGDNLAWGDYNNDGYLDLLVRGNTTMGTMLFENQGPPYFTFADVTLERGLNCRGYSIWADYDNDGNLDFYCGDRGDTLWHNEGPPNYNFINATSPEMYHADSAPTEAAAWVDYDNDGFVDLFSTCWVKDNYNTQYNWPNWGMPDHLWHNNGDGTFTDVTQEAGIYRDNPAYAAMSIAVCDYNQDGWQDIYVGNYHLCPNYLWENQGDGTFIDKAGPQHADVDGDADYYQGNGPYYGHTPGCAWGDYDNDLDPDLWVSNLAHKDDERSGMNRGAFCDDSQLLESSGFPEYHFQDVREEVGIPITPSGTIIYDNEGNGYWKDEDYFGCTWGDYDNDGDLDIWIPQVKTYSFWDWCYLWRNNGDRSFTDQAESLGIRVWSNTGAAWADYDNDGDLDLVTEGTYPFKGKRQLHLFQNQGNNNNWLKLKLQGTDANRGAIGVSVIVWCRDGDDQLSMMRTVGGDAGGHGFQNSPVVHFGLGDFDTVERILINWGPDSKTELFYVDTGVTLTIVEGEGIVSIDSLSTSPDQIFEDDVFNAVLSASEILSSGDFKVEWDLDDDGVFESMETPNANGDVLSINWVYEQKGEYNISARLYNSVTHFGDTADITVNVSNPAPIANAGGDLIGWEDNGILFNGGESTDTDSDIKEGLYYKWDFGNDHNTTWSSSPYANHTYPDEGEYIVTLTVMDDDGDTCSDTLNLSIYNVVPIVNAELVINGTEDSVVLFEGSGWDTLNDTDELEYSWLFGDGGYTPWSSEGDAQHIYTQAGTYTAALMVRDGDGDIGGLNITVNIMNLLPEGDLDILNVEAVEDMQVGFSASGEDTISDSEELMYRVDFGDGNITEWQNREMFYHIYNRSGVFQVMLHIMDNSNGTSNVTESITISNVVPTALFTCYPAGSVDENTTVFFNGQGSSDTPSDLEGLNFTWSFEGKRTLYRPVAEYTFQSSGKQKVELIVTDDDGDYSLFQKYITVVNLPPEAFFTIDGEMRVGGTIVLNASGTSDTPGDMVGLEYKWSIGGRKAAGITAEIQLIKEGRTKITLTVTDGDGMEGEYEMTVNILGDDKKIDTTGDDGSSGLSNWTLILIIVVVMAGVIILAIVLVLKRKSKRDDSGDGTTAGVNIIKNTEMDTIERGDPTEKEVSTFSDGVAEREIEVSDEGHCSQVNGELKISEEPIHEINGGGEFLDEEFAHTIPVRKVLPPPPAKKRTPPPPP